MMLSHPLKCLPSARAALAPGFDLATQGDIPALTLSPAAWGEAFRLWRDGAGKDVENRSHDKYRALVGKWVALHAGASVGCKGVGPWEACEAVNDLAAEAGRTLNLTPSTVITRAVVAVGFVDALYPPGVGTPGAGGGPWRFPGEWGYHFAEVVVLDPPVLRVVGAQGVWNLRGDVRERVMRGFLKARGMP